MNWVAHLRACPSAPDDENLRGSQGLIAEDAYVEVVGEEAITLAIRKALDLACSSKQTRKRRDI